jgi:hypothetical protein
MYNHHIFTQTSSWFCLLFASRAANMISPPAIRTLPENACAPVYEPPLDVMIAPHTGEPSKAPIPIDANTMPKDAPIFDVSEMMIGTMAKESDWTPPTDRL